MTSARSLAYLDAMGIETWVPRPVAGAMDLLKVSSGAGTTLVLCGGPSESESPLAADIERCLAGSVVWGWLWTESDTVNSVESPPITLTQSIDQHLFTRVIVFGSSLLSRIMPSQDQAFIGSARILASCELPALGSDAKAKRSLWQSISQSG
jgi:DNA polymerase III psi subunit